MTEVIQLRSAELLHWMQRHIAAIGSIVFAIGFAWSQFAEVQNSLAETRRQLQALHQAFIDFRLSGAGVTKQELADAVQRQRDTDRRQEDELAFLRDRLIAIRADFQRLLERSK